MVKKHSPFEQQNIATPTGSLSIDEQHTAESRIRFLSSLQLLYWQSNSGGNFAKQINVEYKGHISQACCESKYLRYQ